MKQLNARNSSNGELYAILITFLNYKEIYIDCEINLKIENTSKREIKFESPEIIYCPITNTIYTSI